MLKTCSIALAIATVSSIGTTHAKQRTCSATEEKKMIAKCGGYLVWINRVLLQH
jgi:hypothetical protein